MKSSPGSIIDVPLVNLVNGYDNFAYEDTFSAANRSAGPQSESNMTFKSVDECDDITLKVTDDNEHQHRSASQSKRSSLTRLNAVDIDSLNDSLNAQMKFIHLSRESLDTSYGYSFKTFSVRDKHFINLVGDDSPAFKAGLRQGDLIVEVNGEPVSGLTHKQVVVKMRKNPLEINLTVISDLDTFQQSLEELNAYLKKTGNRRNKHQN